MSTRRASALLARGSGAVRQSLVVLSSELMKTLPAHSASFISTFCPAGDLGPCWSNNRGEQCEQVGTLCEEWAFSDQVTFLAFCVSVTNLCTLCNVLNFSGQARHLVFCPQRLGLWRRMLSKCLNITALTLINISPPVCLLQVLSLVSLILSFLYLSVFISAFVHLSHCLHFIGNIKLPGSYLCPVLIFLASIKSLCRHMFSL